MRGLPDISWHGTQLNHPAWNDPGACLLAVTYGGTDNDADLHLMMNMGNGIAEFELPSPTAHTWQRVLDTSLPSPNDIAPPGEGVDIDGSNYIVNSHSIVLLASVAMTKRAKSRAT